MYPCVPMSYSKKALSSENGSFSVSTYLRFSRSACTLCSIGTIIVNMSASLLSEIWWPFISSASCCACKSTCYRFRFFLFLRAFFLLAESSCTCSCVFCSPIYYDYCYEVARELTKVSKLVSTEGWAPSSKPLPLLNSLLHLSSSLSKD